MIIKILLIVTLFSLSLFAQVIYHNGYLYTFVKSPYTGNIWLNKNIGAQRECLFSDDIECYGDLFQWGRDADGHEKDTYKMTKVQADKLAHLDYPFIVASKKKNRDWAKKIDKDGTKRQKHWKRIDGLGICPTGFRVPTIEELESETIIQGKVYNKQTAVLNFLKLPSSGYRSSHNGLLMDKDSNGYIWSSSIDGAYSESLYFSDDTADTYTHNRADAMSVRCIRKI